MSDTVSDSFYLNSILLFRYCNCRLYHGTLGRFFGIDLLADWFTDQSPFHFGYNNPISFMDPTGLHNVPARPTETIGKGGYLEMIDDYNGWAIVIEINQPNLPIPEHTVEFIDHSGSYGGGGGGSGGGGGGSRSGSGSGNSGPKGANNPNPDSSPDIDTDLLSSALDFGELVAEDLGKSKIAKTLGRVNVALSVLSALAEYQETGSVSMLGYDITVITVSTYVGMQYAGVPGVIAGVTVGLLFELGKIGYDKYMENIYPYIYDKYNQFRNNIHNQALGNWMNYR